MREIKLSNGMVALVDDEDFEWLNQYKWSARKDRKTWYARRRAHKHEGLAAERVIMHRAIMKEQGPDVLIDHEDGCGLNNQRLNLRRCNKQQSQCNRSTPKSNTSGFKGVTTRHHKTGDKYEAAISVDGKQKYLGTKNTPEEAHQLYCEASTKLHGIYHNTGDQWQR